MGFPENIAKMRLERQDGKCAVCGKTLVWENWDKGSRGAWHAHHIDGNRRDNTLSNCALLCINAPQNCHLKVGHSGDFNKGKLAPRSKFKLIRKASIWDTFP